MKGNRKQRKLTERILSLFLALAMCVSLIPAQALAMESNGNAPVEAAAGEAVWKMQNFGGDRDLEIQEGWITPDEEGTGFLADYGKMYQAMGGNVIIYDSAAESYKDSILEFDVTVTGGQPGKYQVAFFPRFQSGRNCDGFAVGEKAQLQHSYQVNGGEGWPGVGNNLGMSFEVDQTYHMKLVTAGNTMAVYVGGQLLTSFETRGEITEGGYGFRIWTQANEKTVHIANVNRREYVVSSLGKNEEVIKAGDWGKKDVMIPVTFGSGDIVESVKNADAVLTEGTDYTADENGIILKKEYIAAQEESFSLKIAFAGGSEADFTVTKLDTSVKEYTWTPEKGIDEWNKIAGSGSVAMEENGLRVKGDTKLVNTNSPSLSNGEIEMTFEQKKDDSYLGLLFRATADNKWQGVMSDDDYVLSRWYYHNSDGTRTGIHGDGSFLLSRDGEADTKLKLRFVGKTISLWLDDQFMYTGNVSQVSDALGKMGILTGSKADILVKKVVFRSVQPFMAEADDSEGVTISKDGLNVTLAADFPRVKEYELNGKTMKGAEFKHNYVTINSVDYPASATAATGTDSVTYSVTADGSGVTFDVVYTVLDGHILDMHIQNIVEPEGELVYSIGLPNQPMISANSSQAGAKLDASGFTENMGSFHNSRLSDVHYNISENRISKTTDQVATIPVITTNELSASMANNVLLNIQEFKYRAFDLPDGTVSAGFWNNEFMYRGLDGEKIFPIASEPEEENLYCRVAITEDTNNDSRMDWQDGANALKKLVGDRIPGSKNAARSFYEVGYNFVSEAQQPFIKVGDNLKRMSNLIDGFDQILVLKGYANEGHDSGHADYDDISKRAGGAEDLNAMTEAIKEINATFGIHINHTESYPEAEMYNHHAVSTHNAWAWMDQSQNIRREVDILNTAEGQRTMDERLDSMFTKAPGIDFVYVDTYTDDRWCETRLADNLIGNGAMIGTENQNDFNRYNTWVHWPEISANSIHHFVYHTQKDVYQGSPIYWGGYGRADSFMSWQHRNNINVVMKQFYTNQLPQKYLMCHEVLKDDGTTGCFEGNVTSSNYQIRKDGSLLTDGTDKIFIPWYAEDSENKNPDEAAKIYHWNTNGGETTWNLPASWSKVKNVYLYQTTQTGKKLVDTIAVSSDGRITINAEASTPYVVYPGEAKADETKWSVGSPIKDSSFNSRDFSIWEKSGSADIQFNDDGNGVSILTMNGTEKGAVSQTMTGLVPGQKYRALVWAGSENGKTARITVKTPDGKTHSNYVDQIVRANDCFDTYAKGKRVERVWVDFVQPEGETTATITLSADACANAGGKATFMESRIVKTAEPDLPTEGAKKYVANETFEYVEQGGTGIFTPEGGGDGGYHLSHYTEYTDDAININGEWSLKMYGYGSANMRTYPASMRLEPNTEYTMEFDALGNGTVMVVSEADGSDKPMSEKFSEGHSTFTFTTGEKADYIVRFEGGSRKVLDNFEVYTLLDLTAPTVPANVAAEVEKDTHVKLTWDASADEDTSVSRYIVYRDGTEIGTSKTTEYVDQETAEDTTYEYQISAVNATGVESAKSEKVSATTGSDSIAPELLSGKIVSGTEILLQFNETLDEASAQNPANYIASAGVRVTKAELQEDQKSVVLTVENLPTEKPFTVQVSGVKDNSKNANTCMASKVIKLSTLVRYYKFDEEDTAKAVDFMGNEDGKKVNTVASVDGMNGKAASFNNSKVQISKDALYGVKEWTTSMWLKWNGPTGESQTIWGNGISGNAGADGMWFHIRNDRKIYVSPWAYGTGVDFASKDTIPENEWIHVTLTKDKDSRFTLYVNGEEAVSGTYNFPTDIPNDLHIGSNYNGGSSLLHKFNGSLDEFKIYNTILSAEQIKAMADDTTFAPTLDSEELFAEKTETPTEFFCGADFNNWTLSSITNGETVLDAASYEVTANGVVFTAAYMDSLKAGDYVLEFTFAKGEETKVLSLNLHVVEENKAVEDGIYIVTVNGKEVDRGEYNKAVEITAPNAPAGKVFAGWKVDGKIISLEETYRFYLSNDIDFIAVYEDAPLKLQAQAMMTNMIVTKRQDTKSDVKYVGQLVLPKGYTIVNAGLVWSSKDGVELITADGKLNTAAKITYINKISNTWQFSVTIKGMPAGRSMHGAIFATVKDAKGNTQLIYSDARTAEAN